MENGTECWLRFLDGDESGFVEIVRDHRDGLILYLNGLVKNFSAAEELAEDTFVKLGLKKPRFSESSSFRTWLYAIGRNAAVDWLRKQARQGTDALDESDEPTDGENLENAYLREERKILVHKAMKRLKTEYRQVLWLIYFDGFSDRETAKIMKKSVHGIETLVCRARQALRAELIKEGISDENL